MNVFFLVKNINIFITEKDDLKLHRGRPNIERFVGSCSLQNPRCLFVARVMVKSWKPRVSRLIEVHWIITRETVD